MLPPPAPVPPALPPHLRRAAKVAPGLRVLAGAVPAALVLHHNLVQTSLAQVQARAAALAVWQGAGRQAGGWEGRGGGQAREAGGPNTAAALPTVPAGQHHCAQNPGRGSQPCSR